jgi:hypothetical protein
MARKLLYSERKRLAETGSLGPLTDEPSDALRKGLAHLAQEAIHNGAQGTQFKTAVSRYGFQYLDWVSGESLPWSFENRHGDDFLDHVELLAQQGIIRRTLRPGTFRAALPGAEATINDLFDRHRFAYRIEGGEIRKINSPALDETVIGPALLAVKKEGWEEAERNFKEAIQHQRGPTSENDDALTAANAALESALKAAGYSGSHLSQLAKDFRNSGTVPGELKGVPEALDTLLKRSGAIRDNHGDAHGKAAGAAPVPQALVDLAINWAGAFIVYLSDAVSTEPKLS